MVVMLKYYYIFLTMQRQVLTVYIIFGNTLNLRFISHTEAERSTSGFVIFKGDPS